MSKAPTDKTPAAEAETGADAPPLAAFESSVAELESLVESLEAGDISLEQALAKFERGVTLARQCQTMLKSAELRVDQLVGQAPEERVEPFSGPVDTAD
ncbi:exodeoxyribonuclease VII small subunit [Salinisphaera hydrothermalis]|uniref:Exodeoxyribonuclease 7 small subunit n=1 Tax=Salinisphaera hydrothermalis (strain C41B8) TaxID=1304275 RepID=A0A084IQ71_SALHC|nr:exodeoxyribonuclease VII small subunit [Salinisphaera hydrothermalis]KEZ78855.1 exonuclease vII small subunit protein [Salinisphaera hydrothermalis C41B8]